MNVCNYPRGKKGSIAIGSNSGGGITEGSGNTILGSDISGLAIGLKNHIILASGGVSRAEFDGTDWTLSGGIQLKETLLDGTFGRVYRKSLMSFLFLAVTILRITVFVKATLFLLKYCAISPSFSWCTV